MSSSPRKAYDGTELNAESWLLSTSGPPTVEYHTGEPWSLLSSYPVPRTPTFTYTRTQLRILAHVRLILVTPLLGKPSVSKVSLASKVRHAASTSIPISCLGYQVQQQRPFGSIDDTSASISSSPIPAPVIRAPEGEKPFGTVPATVMSMARL